MFLLQVGHLEIGQSGSCSKKEKGGSVLRRVLGTLGNFSSIRSCSWCALREGKQGWGILEQFWGREKGKGDRGWESWWIFRTGLSERSEVLTFSEVLWDEVTLICQLQTEQNVPTLFSVKVFFTSYFSNEWRIWGWLVRGHFVRDKPSGW